MSNDVRIQKMSICLTLCALKKLFQKGLPASFSRFSSCVALLIRNAVTKKAETR